jgi:hypothetical protein
MLLNCKVGGKLKNYLSLIPEKAGFESSNPAFSGLPFL